MKLLRYWIVEGVSWAGKPVKRNGRRVTCGHKHLTADNARACLRDVRQDRPGNCQSYAVAEIVLRPEKRA